MKSAFFYLLFAAVLCFSANFETKEPAKDSDGYFLVGSFEELLWTRNYVNSLDTSLGVESLASLEKIRLIADIEVPEGFSIDTIYKTDFPSGYYYIFFDMYFGNFDGENHKILGLNYPLFRYVYGTVQNLELIGGEVVYVARLNRPDLTDNGILGVRNNGTVRNVHVKGNIRSEYNIGGIVGYNRATIDSCSFEGEITGRENIGGIAGDNSGKITNCETSGKITITGESSGDKRNYFGGIAGRNNGGSIDNCKNNSSFLILNNAWAYYVGGIAGLSSGPISNSVNKADIEIDGFQKIGGIAGAVNNDTIYSCTNEGNITLTNNTTFVGGIVGYGGENGDHYKLAVVIDSHNKGDVIATHSSEYVGGIAGTSVRVKRSDNIGNVEAKSHVGGIIGYNGTADSCYNEGNIKAVENYAGGISGTGVGVLNSFNQGKISGQRYIGGLSGQVDGIFNSFNLGEVQGSWAVGGLAGEFYIGDISHSYNKGNVSGIHAVGGICGNAEQYHDLSLTFTYNEGDVEGMTDVGGICGGYTYNLRYEDFDILYTYNVGEIKQTSTDTVGRLGGLVARYLKDRFNYSFNYGKIAANSKDTVYCLSNMLFSSKRHPLPNTRVFYNEDSGACLESDSLNANQRQSAKAFKDGTVLDMLNADSAYWVQGELYPVFKPYEEIVHIRDSMKAHYKDSIRANIDLVIRESPFSIDVNGLNLTISGAKEGASVRLFDCMGKVLLQAKIEKEFFVAKAPATGIYILKVGNTSKLLRLMLH